MPWLFKDPINKGLAQFDHAQPNSKKWPNSYKDQIVPNEFFSQKTTNEIFMYLLAPFILQNLKKFLELTQSYDHVPFSGPKWPICHEQIFLVQTIIITFIYLLALFIVQNLKKFLQRIQSYEDAQFLGPKWPISPNENFFRKPVNEPCFFHSCLSTCQKSKSDINLLVKYWRLKNTEISLAESHFWL